MHADRRMQAAGRLPGAVAHAGDELALGAGRMQRQRAPTDGDDVTLPCCAAQQYLQALDRRVDVAGGAAGAGLLAEHRPRLQRRAQLQLQAAVLHDPAHREAELAMRGEPAVVDRQAAVAQFAAHVGEIVPYEPGQHPAVVQLRAPVGERRPVRLAPEAGDQGADQQLLRQAHVGMRRHLAGAHLQQALATAGGIRRVQLVDRELGPVGVAGEVGQQMPHDPVGHPRRLGRAGFHQVQGRLQFVGVLGAGLVGAGRLRGGADEQAAEQVGQRRMVVPVGDHAGEEVGPAQERAVEGGRPAQGDVVAAAGAGVPPIDLELLGAQPGQAGLIVELARH